MTSLITTHDLGALHGPSRLGVDVDAWNEMARRAILQSALWLGKFVPEATLAEAKADILAGTADDVQERLRQAQLHWAIALLYEGALSTTQAALGGNGMVRVGDVALDLRARTESGTASDPVRHYKQKAIRFLQAAGYAWEVTGGTVR